MASAVKAKSCVNFNNDPRKDDINLQNDRDGDLNEPPRIGRDDMMPSFLLKKERSIESIEGSLSAESTSPPLSRQVSKFGGGKSVAQKSFSVRRPSSKESNLTDRSRRS